MIPIILSPCRKDAAPSGHYVQSRKVPFISVNHRVGYHALPDIVCKMLVPLQTLTDGVAIGKLGADRAICYRTPESYDHS